MTDAVRRGEGPTLRAGAAGVVCGLGVYFVVQHLVLWAGGLVSDLPFLVLSVAVIYAGSWLFLSDVPDHAVGRIALASLAGLVGLIGVALWLGGGRTLVSGGAVSTAVDVGTVGASAGLLVGLEGERRRGREPGRQEARRAEAQFAFVNRLLRHHLLNGMAVIQGYAQLLAEAEDEPAPELEVIRRRSDEVADLIRNLETLGRAAAGELPTQSVEPTPPLRAAIETVREDASVAVETDLDHDEVIRAPSELTTVFESVLDAAVNGSGEGPIQVTSRVNDEFVVRIEGGGDAVVPSAERLPATAHDDGGLGLFLAETLVAGVDGRLERTDDGAVVVGLPLA